MERIQITPKDENHWKQLRCLDVTSTEIAALFGCSPYITAFELWHRKKTQEIPEFTVSERMKWGTRLEAAIAAGVGEDNNWNIAPFKDYGRIPELRIGSSFDFHFETRSSPMDHGLLEIKNVDPMAFKDGWIVDGDDVEAPLHIELQVQHQMLVSGHSQAFIAALVGGNKVVLIKRLPDEKTALAIGYKVKEFWASIDADKPPEPNFAQDAVFISQLYNIAKPGRIAQVNGNARILELVQSYKDASAIEKAAKEQKDAAKAELLMMSNEAEKMISDEFTISMGMVGPAHVEYDREGYRLFKINWRKPKT